MSAGLDLDHLSKLAEAATPGEWFVGAYEPVQKDGLNVRQGSADGPRIAACAGAYTDELAASNAAYIAALDPATVQELIRLARIGQQHDGA